MRLTNLLLAIIVAFSIVSCSDSSSDDKITSLLLSIKEKEVEINDNISYTVLDNNETDVTSKVDIYVDGVKTDNNTIKATKSGEISVYAQLEEVKSNIVKVKVLSKSSLVLSVDKTVVKSDGVDKPVLSIKDSDGNVISDYELYVNGEKSSSKEFVTTEDGVFELYVSKDEIRSNKITINSTSLYTKNILIEDYTGTWCGWCPRIIYALSKFEHERRVIPVAIHDDMEMRYSNVGAMKSKFGVTGFPTAFTDRSRGFELNVSLDDLIGKKSNVGIEISSTYSGNEANVNVDVNFNSPISEKLKIVVYLLENGLVYKQENYLTGRAGYEKSEFYTAPGTINNYEHNHVLRKASTDVFGDEVPTNNSSNGNKYSKSYSINLSGYKPGNCDIVVFVLYDDNQSKSGVINTQKVKLGESITF